MRPRLAAVLLALPALAPGGEGALRLRAGLEAGGLRISAEGPLPRDAVLRIQVFREVAAVTRREPVQVADVRTVFEEAGRLDALLPVGDALSAPGHYRVRAEFETAGQYPAVLEALRGETPPPAEVPLLVGMDSEAFLDEVLAEQAFLEDALDRVDAFLAAWGAHAAAVPEDPKAAIPAWEAWRGPERAFLELLILRGRRECERCYPGTYADFAEGYVFHGIFQTESRAFLNAGTGKPVLGTGPLKGGAAPGPGALAPYRKLFLRETLHYRLEAAGTLARAVKAELEAQGAAPDRARWSRKRAVWGRILERLASRTERLPAKDHADAVPASLRAWIDAAEAARFDRGPSPAPAEEAFRAAAEALRKDLDEAGRGAP